MRLVDFLDQSLALSCPESSDAHFFDLDNNLSFSYLEMVNSSIHLAHFLVKSGVKSQDVVATYAPNSVAAFCCIFAISRIGAIWLPLNTKNTVNANIKLISISDAKFLFIEEEIYTQNPQLFDSFDIDKISYLSKDKIADFNLSVLKSPVHDNSLPKTNFFEKNPNKNQYSSPYEEEIVSLFPTGGTTGDPKLAKWGTSSWNAIIDIQNKQMQITDISPCYLVSAPMTHAAGIGSFATILQGGSIVVMDGFSPEKILNAIQKYKVTSLFLPPTAIYMLLSFDNIKFFDFSSLRHFWYAAAPMSVDKLKEAISIFGPVMVQTYGQAEAPMICTFFSAQDHIKAINTENNSILGSCGKASPGIEIVILDEHGDLVPEGSKGEIAIKGELLMNGYYKNSEATNCIRVNGWQLTGDIGILDQEGYLSLVDRKGDMIISGGFNIYPGEIEQLIWGIPSIRDCAVIGLPDEKWGEKVTAVIELKDPNISPTEDEIIQLCKEKLGSVKAPKKIIIFDELPRSPVGKVLKKDLRSIFWGDTKRKI